MLKFCSALCVLSLCFVAPLAHADTTYTSQSAFAAAAPSLTTLTFNSGGYFTYEGSSYTQGAVTFSNAYSAAVFLTSPGGYYGSSYGSDFLNVAYGTGGDDTLVITIPSSNAVGFNIGGLFGPVDIPVTLSDGFSTTIVAPDSITGTNNLDFFGVITTTPITSLTLYLPDNPNYSALANFSYGSTPEPSSLILMATGLAGAAGAIRRKLRS